MNFLPSLLGQRRLILATVSLLALTGLIAWNTMPREEDPQFPERSGLVVTAFPGADAETVERLVVEPIEERLAEVEDIREVFSTARTGVAVINVDLKSTIYDTDAVWDDVEEALARARQDFPTGVLEPSLDHDLIAQEAIVLAVGGSADPLQLSRAAKEVKRELLALPEIRRVKLIADPEEQITVEYDDATARRLGIDPLQLGRSLGQRSSIVPGGMIHLGAKTANLRPQTEFRSLAEIRATPVLLPSGTAVPLGELAKVRQGPAEPAVERMRHNGELVVGLGVVPKDNIDRIKLGKVLRARLEEIAAEIAPLSIQEVIFQPDQVDFRLRNLSRSLQLGILIVALVLLLTMGFRLGMLVTLIVPLVTFGSIALFAAGGGILNQISIAALVIALGMLVDNAIVVSESIQWRVDRGEPTAQASVEAVRELAVPLGTATGTTLAAFVPMAISSGDTADFTRSIPILILLTLTVSYVFAVLVTPALAELLLRRRQRQSAAVSFTRRLAELTVEHRGAILVATAVLLVLTLLGAGYVEQQFFPAADRNLMVVDLKLPEGTHLEHTSEISQKLERALAARDEVVAVSAFIGRSAPHFYYNLQAVPNSPHLAQVVATTRRLEDVEALMAWTRDFAQHELLDTEVVARRLEQGPSLDAPIEVRLYGQDFEHLEVAVNKVLRELRAIPGTRDVRHSLSLGAPTVGFTIDDAAAARHGLSRADVANVLQGRTLGVEIGQYRVGEDPVPILVRSSSGEELPPDRLATLDIAVAGGRPVPLSQLTDLDIVWRPAAIYHHQRSRLAKVQAQLAEGVTANEIIAILEPRLAAAELPADVHRSYGGEQEESGQANAALLRAMPLGIILLLFFLLAQFNSFRRVGIILVTVPLAAVGVVPGLLLSGQPFGFMATLGVVSLVGIVVNNAIVLLDVVEQRRREGAEVEAAVSEAVERRTRPILLTMGTTVAGLTPLALSNTTLWPPLAWAMISGLTASSLLTLFVVPALYVVLFRPRSGSVPRLANAVS